jgi:hypothetical protein
MTLEGRQREGACGGNVKGCVEYVCNGKTSKPWRSFGRSSQSPRRPQKHIIRVQLQVTEQGRDEHIRQEKKTTSKSKEDSGREGMARPNLQEQDSKQLMSTPCRPRSISAGPEENQQRATASEHAATRQE